MKTPALIIINEILLEYGLTQSEIDLLMSRFLEEEAYDYVKTMEYLEDIIMDKCSKIIYKN